MPFYFLQPIYLLALAATSIPLLIHLLNRRRLRRIRFPAVRFVLISQRRITRSYRLRHWIILALRTFAILLLVLLLAGPIFQSGIGLFAGGSSLSLVVVLDNSLSMKWSQDGKGFEKAKEAARLLLTSLREGDQAALIPTHLTNMESVRFKGEKEALYKELNGIHLTAQTADFSLALRRAYELLRRPAAQKAIWLITDLTLTGWDRFDLSSLGQYDPLIPLKIIKVGKKGELLNATIREVKVLNRELAVGLPLHLEAEIINFSDKAIRDLPVELSLDNRQREQRLVNLPPKGEMKVSFQFELGKTGAHPGYVRLKKPQVAGNPIYHFVIEPQEKLKVLIVDGDPKTSLVQSESFFISRSLNPTGELNSSIFLPTVIIPETLETVSLKNYQAIILCNLPVIPDRVLPRLTEYLRQGGGVLLFLGDRVQKDQYNRSLFRSGIPILPAPLGDKRILPQAEGVRIKKVDTSHDTLQGFDDPILKASLQSIRVHGYFRTPSANGSKLLTLANGDPLLVEKKIGSGHLLLFTTAADRDWSDLPFKTAYLPLVQSLVIYLSSDKRGSVDTGITAGAKKTFHLPPSFVGKKLRIVRPDLKKREISLSGQGQNAVASLEGNDLAGIYQLSLQAVQASGSSPVPALYAVNPPFLESRLQEIAVNELETKFNPMKFEIIDSDSLVKGGTKMDLSLPLLFLVMVTLATEGWLAQRLHE